MIPSEGILHKFMLEIRQYPDGRIFPKIYMVGAKSNFKKKVKKPIKQIRTEEVETVYL